MKGNQLASMPIKELIRTIDTEEEENEYVACKLKELKHLVDVKARQNLTKMQMTESALKCYYGCNPYGVRHKLINAGTTNSECPRCSEEETWEHVVQCKKTVSMRAEFILNLHADLKKVQIEDVPDYELRLIIEDIRKFMRDEVDNYNTNQQIIGMKHLFRGFSVKAWKGAQFNNNKYTNLNRILNQHCMEYYCKCWKDRNEKLHDEETQRSRVIEWRKKIRKTFGWTASASKKICERKCSRCAELYDGLLKTVDLCAPRNKEESGEIQRKRHSELFRNSEVKR